VRSWVGWFGHVTLVLLVMAVLTVLCAQERVGPPVSTEEVSHHVTPSPIPLTVPEVRRLLGRLLFPLPRSAMVVLARELVAARPSGEGTRLSRKTAPELELVVRSLSPFSRPEGLLTASRARLRHPPLHRSREEGPCILPGSVLVVPVVPIMLAGVV